jgi:DNA invertase Pin-like site-specific DNA recombinase
VTPPRRDHKAFSTNPREPLACRRAFGRTLGWSTAKGEQELPLEEQERWAREHASGLGEPLKVFSERASAKSVIGRPVFQKLIAELEELISMRRPKQIAVTSFDRLSRDMTDTLVASRTLRSLKVDLYVRGVGVAKADTFAQRAALVGQSMGDEAENEARSNRIKASWEAAGAKESRPPTKCLTAYNSVGYGEIRRMNATCRQKAIVQRGLATHSSGTRAESVRTSFQIASSEGHRRIW